jgi:hypothetical protein
VVPIIEGDVDRWPHQGLRQLAGEGRLARGIGTVDGNKDPLAHQELLDQLGHPARA